MNKHKKNISKRIQFLYSMLLIVTISISCSQVKEDNQGFEMPAKIPTSPFADVSGSHVGIRVENYQEAVTWWKDKLDFRVLREWSFGEQKLAYLAPANDDTFWIEILGGGKLHPQPQYTEMEDLSAVPGFQHLCINVENIEMTLATLKKRGIEPLDEPFHLKDISRKLAFIQDPWGNVIELAELIKE